MGIPQRKRKRARSFRVFSARCPHCGDDDTRLDLAAVENLKLVPVAILAGALIGSPTGVRMRCSGCGHGFIA
jgi:hypothetical protein